jgi:glutamate N-acetyltransferase/amino-acid N-acetyltransferase
MTKSLPEAPPTTGGIPVHGFRFAAVSAGIRKDGRADLGLVVADGGTVAAGLFTRNLVRAAPVVIAAERLRAGGCRVVLANSGCANACTGAAGHEAALRGCEAVARALGLPSSKVLPASTGVIGALLPAERIERVAGDLVASLTPNGFSAFATAIMTTDRWPKLAHARIGVARGSVTVLGIAKGAGMIHPDMGPDEAPHATMLAFLCTDAAVARSDLEGALSDAVERTFNRVSVDGDTSTNDCVLAFASGKSGLSPSRSELFGGFAAVCDELARSMVADGEGASHVAELRVRGLSSDADALRIARTVATSLLVKTALHGQDANWGRLLAAAGRAGVAFDPGAASIVVGDVTIVERGTSLGAEAEARAKAVLAGQSFVIELVLGRGPGRAHYLTSDLGHEYIDINAGYRS